MTSAIRLEDVTPEYFDQRIAVNLKHQFFCVQAVVDDMKKAGGGSIINMGSTSWMVGTERMPVYTAAKAGVVRHDPRPRPRRSVRSTSGSTRSRPAGS